MVYILSVIYSHSDPDTRSLQCIDTSQGAPAIQICDTTTGLESLCINGGCQRPVRVVPISEETMRPYLGKFLAVSKSVDRARTSAIWRLWNPERGTTLTGTASDLSGAQSLDAHAYQQG